MSDIDSAERVTRIILPGPRTLAAMQKAVDALDPDGLTMIRDGEEYERDRIEDANRQTFGGDEA